MRALAFMLSLVFIFTIPWEGVVRLSGVGTATKFMGFALVAFWLATVVITNRLRKPSPFQIAVSLFVLWNAASVFWSDDPNRTAKQVVTWLQLLGLVFILWDLFTTRTALLAGLQMYVLGAYVAFGSAAQNFFSGAAFYTNYQRFSSGETNPDGFGFILVLGIPMAWYLASSDGITKISGLMKFVNYIYVPMALLGIALSGTRTAAIATVPAMAFGLASLTRLRLWARVAILLFFISAVLIFLPYVQTLTSFQRFSTIGSELSEGDINERTGLWREGLDAFLEHPLTGVGSNMYRSVNSLGKVAHNSYISVLVELGLIGFVLFGIILMMAVIQALRHSKWDTSFWLTQLMVWAIGASTLTWEHRKSTWLFLSLLIVSAALTRYRDETVSLGERTEPEAQGIPDAKYSRLLPGE